MFFFLSFLLILPVWMRGGTRLELMGPAPWLALAAILGMLFRPPQNPQELLVSARVRVWHKLLSDPLLYIGAAFLFLLTLQWWNGPREAVFDVPSWRWTFSPPPKPTLPLFSIDRKEALEMLIWFGPFYAALLVIRNGFLRSQKLDLLKLLAANAALAGLFGAVQYFSHTKSIYWLTPLKVHFFAAFGYQNHAGAFFILAAFLATGLVLRSLLKKDWVEDLSWLAPVLGLCILGAFLSKSRAALLMVGFLVSVGTGYAFMRVGKRHTTHGMAAVLVSLAAFVAVVIYVVTVVPGNPVQEELKGTTLEGVVARVELGHDPLKATAWQVWKDHTWFGVGGWGFRHFLPHYLPDRKAYASGQANVHNDPLQFLAEFGAAGAFLLGVTLLVLMAPALRAIWKIEPADRHDMRSRFMKIPPLGVALLAGPLLTLLHSLADLPFRSPAILWTWGVMLACAPDFCERTERHHRRHRVLEEAEPGEMDGGEDE